MENISYFPFRSLNYALTVKYLKEGFSSSSESVRHAYVGLAGVVYAALGVGCPSANTFRADLEGSSKTAITILLREEFHSRENVASESPHCGIKRKASQVPLSPSLPAHHISTRISTRYNILSDNPKSGE